MINEIYTTHFCAFPALTYWETDGKPVSSKEADYGMHPNAVLRETEVSKNLWKHLEREFDVTGVTNEKRDSYD